MNSRMFENRPIMNDSEKMKIIRLENLNISTFCVFLFSILEKRKEFIESFNHTTNSNLGSCDTLERCRVVQLTSYDVCV